jgi:hypothetical protein
MSKSDSEAMGVIADRYRDMLREERGMSEDERSAQRVWAEDRAAKFAETQNMRLSLTKQAAEAKAQKVQEAQEAQNSGKKKVPTDDNERAPGNTSQRKDRGGKREREKQEKEAKKALAEANKAKALAKKLTQDEMTEKVTEEIKPEPKKKKKKNKPRKEKEKN